MADILWSDVVGASTTDDGGYVGDLLALARAHVDAAVRAGELRQEDAGQIYTAMIPAAFQNGIGFAMQEELTEADINIKVEQLDTEKLNQEAIISKVLDEYGRAIDENGNNNEANDVSTKHYQTIDKLKAENEIVDNQVLTSAEGVITAARASEKARAELRRDFGVEVAADLDLLTETYSYDTVGTDDTVAPISRWEAEMRKSLKEDIIAEATANGYEADAYYKQYKSLQELMFGLSNAGVVDSDAADAATTTPTAIYENIIKGMEINMNKQSSVWADTWDANVDGIDLTGEGTGSIVRP